MGAVVDLALLVANAVNGHEIEAKAAVANATNPVYAFLRGGNGLGVLAARAAKGRAGAARVHRDDDHGRYYLRGAVAQPAIAPGLSPPGCGVQVP